MARTHGRIYSRIWEGDFRKLTRSAQGMYEFLLSQPDLNQAGLIGLRLRRWAGMSSDGTTEALMADIQELEAARYIVVDHDAEEVLIRTFIRNDKVFQQPNVMLAAGNDAREIASGKLRAALLIELDRLPLDELSDEVRGKAERSPRAVVEGVIETLRKAFAELSGDPSPTPPEPLSEAFGKGSRNPSPNPSGNPSGRDVGRHNARVPLPLPLPPSPGSAPSERAAVPPAAPDPPISETEGQRVNRLARAFTDLVPMSNFPAVSGVVRKAVRAAPNGSPLYDDTQIGEALQRLAAEGRSLTVETLRVELDGLPPTAHRHNGARPVSQGFHDGLALAQRMAEHDATTQLAIGDTP